jgi:hypothetical protein
VVQPTVTTLQRKREEGRGGKKKVRCLWEGREGGRGEGGGRKGKERSRRAGI